MAKKKKSNKQTTQFPDTTAFSKSDWFGQSRKQNRKKNKKNKNNKTNKTVEATE